MGIAAVRPLSLSRDAKLQVCLGALGALAFAFLGGVLVGRSGSTESASLSARKPGEISELVESSKVISDASREDAFLSTTYCTVAVLVVLTAAGWIFWSDEEDPEAAKPDTASDDAAPAGEESAAPADADPAPAREAVHDEEPEAVEPPLAAEPPPAAEPPLERPPVEAAAPAPQDDEDESQEERLPLWDPIGSLSNLELDRTRQRRCAEIRHGHHLSVLTFSLNQKQSRSATSSSSTASGGDGDGDNAEPCNASSSPLSDSEHTDVGGQAVESEVEEEEGEERQEEAVASKTPSEIVEWPGRREEIATSNGVGLAVAKAVDVEDAECSSGPERQISSERDDIIGELAEEAAIGDDFASDAADAVEEASCSRDDAPIQATAEREVAAGTQADTGGKWNACSVAPGRLWSAEAEDDEEPPAASEVVSERSSVVRRSSSRWSDECMDVDDEAPVRAMRARRFIEEAPGCSMQVLSLIGQRQQRVPMPALAQAAGPPGAAHGPPGQFVPPPGNFYAKALSAEHFPAKGAPFQAAAQPPPGVDEWGPRSRSGSGQQMHQFGTHQQLGQHHRSERPAPQAGQQHGGQQPPQRQQRQDTDTDMTLRSIMQILDAVEPGRVLQVRRIKHLGFGSAQVLRRYYSQYAPVDKVLVSHSHSQMRVRPASLGFIVMQDVEGVSAILALGTTQDVGGAPIRLGPFERHSAGTVAEEE